MDNQFKKKKIQNAEWVGRSTSKKSIFKFGQSLATLVSEDFFINCINF